VYMYIPLIIAFRPPYKLRGSSDPTPAAKSMDLRWTSGTGDPAAPV
jgi:hypothetical protein